MANTLADVLVEMAHLLPVREEAQFNNWISVIEEVRPALDKLVTDVVTEVVPAVENAVPAVETAVKDTENVIKGL